MEILCVFIFNFFDPYAFFIKIRQKTIRDFFFIEVLSKIDQTLTYIKFKYVAKKFIKHFEKIFTKNVLTIF